MRQTHEAMNTIPLSRTPFGLMIESPLHTMRYVEGGTRSYAEQPKTCKEHEARTKLLMCIVYHQHRR
eukprot:5586090-Amphidinium_carterae.1